MPFYPFALKRIAAVEHARGVHKNRQEPEMKNMPGYVVSIFCFLTIILLGGCEQKNSSSIMPLSQKILHLSINGRSMEMPLSESGALFDVETLNTEFPNRIELINKLPGVSISFDGQALKQGTPIRVKISKIAYDKNIPIVITDGNDTRTVGIRTLNSNIPNYTAAGKSPYSGHYYITLLTIPIVLKLDQAGEIVFYQCDKDASQYAANMAAARADPTVSVNIMSYWDFKKHALSGGKVRYSYHEQSPSYNRLNNLAYSAGTRVVLDEQYNEITRIYQLPEDESSLNAVEGHDFYMIDDGHYIVSNYELRLVHNIPGKLNPQIQGSKVQAAHLQEVKDGVVLLNWYSTDHVELYALSEDGYNDFANVTTQEPDYIHFNSVDIDTDGNLICSFRNISTILKLDRKTGDIIWRLSGASDDFGLSDYQKTSNQHYARKTTDGYITIFDNNVRNKKTRVLKLKIDEGSSVLEEWKEYIVPGHFSVVCGSAMNIENDVFVIGWGFSTENYAALTEIDFAADRKLFELTFPSGYNATYRCAKY